MITATMSLHSHSDGTYTVHLSLNRDGEGIRTILDESSNPMPHVPLSDAWTVASQMAVDALRAVEPGPGLWQASSWSRTG